MPEIDLSSTELFQNISPEDLDALLKCLDVRKKRYQKGEILFLEGAPTSNLGIVLSGRIMIEMGDAWGGRSILGTIGPGGTFAEAYACIPGEKLLIGVTAAEECQILFLEVGKIFHTCPDTCSCHEKLIRNMLMVMAKKNLELPEEAFTRHQNPSGEGCFPIFPRRWCSRAAAGLSFPLTGRSLRII